MVVINVLFNKDCFRVSGERRLYWKKMVKRRQTMCNYCFIRQKLPMEIRGVAYLLQSTGKRRQNMIWSDSWLEPLEMSLAILEVNFCWLALRGCNRCFIRQKWIYEIGWVTALLGKDGKMMSDYNLVGYLFKTLDMKLAILEINFCWLAWSGCNCSFIRQKLPLEIKKVTVLLGKVNDGKMTSDYKLVRCLIGSPWHVISDSSIGFLMTFFSWLQLPFSRICPKKIFMRKSSS